MRHRPDGPATSHPECYDFEVEVPLRWVGGWGVQAGPVGWLLRGAAEEALHATAVPTHASRPLLLRPPTPSHCSTELPPYAAKAGAASKEVEALSAQLTGVLARLAEHRRRRTLLLSFAQAPVDFIHALVAAQVGDGYA